MSIQIKIKMGNNHINGYRKSFTILCQLCMKIGAIATLSTDKSFDLSLFYEQREQAKSAKIEFEFGKAFCDSITGKKCYFFS